MTSQPDTSEHMTLWKTCVDQDQHEFYALLLLPGLDVAPIPFCPGATTRQELVAKVQETYGPDALHVVPYRFSRALLRRKTHQQRMLELLSEYHSLEGNDLQTYVVYGSSLHPLSTSDIRPLATAYGAFSIGADKEQDGYYCYIVAPQFLPEALENAYDFVFISRPQVMNQGV